MATITVRQNGSYKVEGDDVKVVDWNGNEYQIVKRPFSRLADRIIAARRGDREDVKRDFGGALGALGNIIGGE